MHSRKHKRGGIMFPGGKTKALTFSYDDGIVSDKKLVKILNEYGMKGTFNLNSGIMTHANNWDYMGFRAMRMNVDEIGDLYDGHEIAVHCLTHPDLTAQDDDTVKNEILADKANLERMFGRTVCGMAYPIGYYDDRVKKLVAECGIKYSRTVESTHSFDIPDDLISYGPTCHHNDEKIFELAEEFISLKTEKPQVFYIWGHSYEYDAQNNWDRLEKLCRMLAGKDDIYYCSNAQALLGV